MSQYYQEHVGTWGKTYVQALNKRMNQISMNCRGQPVFDDKIFEEFLDGTRKLYQFLIDCARKRKLEVDSLIEQQKNEESKRSKT